MISHIIVSYDQNISLIFYVKGGSHVRLRYPTCVYTTAQRQYTAVQKMHAHLWNNFPYIITLIKIIKISIYRENQLIKKLIWKKSAVIKLETCLLKTYFKAFWLLYPLRLYLLNELVKNHDRYNLDMCPSFGNCKL